MGSISYECILRVYADNSTITMQEITDYVSKYIQKKKAIRGKSRYYKPFHFMVEKDCTLVIMIQNCECVRVIEAMCRGLIQIDGVKSIEESHKRMNSEEQIKVRVFNHDYSRGKKKRNFCTI